jgi:tagaturonate reductase
MLKKLNRQAADIPQTRPVKVLQFGGGNFLRGFADWVIDVLNEKTNFNGAIDIVTSVTPGTAEQINEQDGLYHLIQQGTQNGKRFSETRLITSVNRAINPAQQFDEFLKCAENPDLRFIISNTTEAGIVFDENDKSYQVLPNSFPGKLTLLLYHRFKFFSGSIDKATIIIPCELIEKNGAELKKIILRYSSYWNLAADFTTWIDKNIFCNTLVDRIVPGFPKETIDQFQTTTGYDDKLVVAAEPFYFWAIECAENIQKEFPTQLAALHDVVFANDITPYRIRKVRILNGTHTAFMPVAYLRGLRTVKEAMDDPDMEKFILDTIKKEIVPTLALPEPELSNFASAVADRFRNPFIKHQLISISLNSISKFRIRVVPTIVEYIQKNNTAPPNLMRSLAALICFYRGNWQGNAIPLNDTPDVISIIQDAWKEQDLSKVISEILSNPTLWGSDLTRLNGVTEAVQKNVLELQNQQ